MMIIILITLVIILITRPHIKIEGLSESPSTQGSPPDSTKKQPYTGTFNSTFNGRMAIDDQYFYDKLFDNVVYYPNEYERDYKLNDIVITGCEKCRLETSGNCVEYGVTGACYAFNY